MQYSYATHLTGINKKYYFYTGFVTM